MKKLSFRSLSEKPYFDKKLTSSNASASLISLQDKYCVELFIDSSDKLQSFSFQSSSISLNPIFSALGFLGIGLTLEELSQLSNKELNEYWSSDLDFKEFYNSEDYWLIDIPFYLLKKAIENYLGTERGQVMARDKHLICLCFGVHFEDMARLQSQERSLSLKSFMAKTLAGTGCGGCTITWKKLFATPYRFKGHPNVYWIQRAEEELEKEFKGLHWEIQSFSNGRIIIMSKDLSLGEVNDCLKRLDRDLEVALS